MNSQQRTYKNSMFFYAKYENYILGGDIYDNTGDNAGTIYNDLPMTINLEQIPYYYPFNYRGLVVLLPFYDENGVPNYDSTFLITLSDNSEIDPNAIVIGEIYEGLDIVDKINKYLKPVAAKNYPTFKILDCGILFERNRNSYIVEYLKSKRSI